MAASGLVVQVRYMDKKRLGQGGQVGRGSMFPLG